MVPPRDTCLMAPPELLVFYGGPRDLRRGNAITAISTVIAELGSRIQAADFLDSHLVEQRLLSNMALLMRFVAISVATQK